MGKKGRRGKGGKSSGNGGAAPPVTSAPSSAAHHDSNGEGGEGQAEAPPEGEGYNIVIKPMPMSAADSCIGANLVACSLLFGDEAGQRQSTMGSEIGRLKSELGWSDPRGLMAYSGVGRYRDLYVYFDHGDTTGPVNELATHAFKMFGLEGGGNMDWDVIRGAAVVIRNEPPSGSPGGWGGGFDFSPIISCDEMYLTLKFFRDSSLSAREIAVKRDMIRTQGTFAPVGRDAMLAAFPAEFVAFLEKMEGGKNAAEEGGGGDGAGSGGGAAGGGGDAQLPPLRPGLRVRVHGLTSKQGRKLNGKIARVMTKQPDGVSANGRVAVKVVGDASGKPVAVKRSNLRTGDEACCAVCDKTDCELKACGICREMGLPRIYYCSRECQEEDWKKHKKVHKMAKSALTVPVSEEMRKRAEITLAVKPDHAKVLCEATRSGDLEMCAALIDCGVDPDGVVDLIGMLGDGRQTTMTTTPLMVACQEGHEHVALLLINEGCDVNFADSNTGQAPLHMACATGMLDTVKLLLDKGAQINQVSKSGGTALLIACVDKRYELVELLLLRGADSNLQFSNQAVVVLESGSSLLHIACGSEGTQAADLAIATLLVSHGAKVNERGGPDGHTPLWYACATGQTSIVAMLLTHGADPNKVAVGSNAEYTPLVATYVNVDDPKKRDEIIELLLANGAKPQTPADKQRFSGAAGGEDGGGGEDQDAPPADDLD